jgi:SAM-dependent methyltransferase
MCIRTPCPICEGTSSPLDVVDFNKSCEEARGKYLPLTGVPIYYFLCEQCGFCFAPEFSQWQLEDFEKKIYNSEYLQVDPDYLDVRPRANANSLISAFRDRGSEIRHLDYGGGKGLLSDLLRKSGWQTTSYDPFVDREIYLENLGKFDLITAYEVFEHVPDVKQLISNLSSLLVQDGVVLFSTLLSDGNLGPRQRISWWYASPRNGHISLFSRKSLAILGAKERFHLGSSSSGFHAFWRNVPPWAKHIIRVG